MAVLSDDDRVTVWAEFMRDTRTGEIGITKAQLRQVINEIDDWIDDNAASFNQTISQPMRNAVTTKQKVMLFMFVAGRRYEVQNGG